MSLPQDINDREYSKFDNDNRVLVNPDILPTSGNNASLSISEATVGTVTTTTIQKTIGSTTYEQTIEEDSSDNSVEVSVWSET